MKKNATLPVRKSVQKVTAYHPPEDGRLPKIRLDFNENTTGCSPLVRRALAKLTARQIAMYPEYRASTRNLAKYFGVRTEELMLTNGGDESLRAFVDAFVDPGTGVVICEPAFPMYRQYAEIMGADIRVAPYGAEMEFPMAQVLAALRKKPRLLFVTNPNNPTGTLLRPQEIEKILKAATHTAVVVDEAYAEFSGVTVIPLIHKYSNLFVARTCSKATGLAGLRLGAAIACVESIAVLRRVMPPYPVNVAALVAAEAALGDQRRLKAFVRDTAENRNGVEKELRALGVKTFPSVANFMLVNFGPRGTELVQALEKKNILLRNRGDGFVRISIGTRQEMKRLVQELAKLLRAHS